MCPSAPNQTQGERVPPPGLPWGQTVVTGDRDGVFPPVEHRLVPPVPNPLGVELFWCFSPQTSLQIPDPQPCFSRRKHPPALAHSASLGNP